MDGKLIKTMIFHFKAFLGFRAIVAKCFFKNPDKYCHNHFICCSPYASPIEIAVFEETIGVDPDPPR